MSLRIFNKSAIVGATIFAGSALSGCAGAPPPPELLDARSAYIRASSGPAAQYKPDSIHEAKVALEKAEIAYEDDPRSEATKHIAYLALRRTELAEVEGRNYQAALEKQKAEQQLASLTQSQLSRSREQLASASDRLSGAEQQLANERAMREAAEKRAKDALDKLAASAAVKQETRGTVITLPGNVLFGTGKSTLLPGAQTKLDSVAEALKDQADHDIVIEGHTDAQGSDDTNLKLSQDRAQSVRDYVVARGIPTNRVRVVGVGEARPVADNSTPEGRAQNRRVEIIVAPAADKTSTTDRSPTTIDTPPSTDRKPSPAGTAPIQK
jgi:outer membrane protein OmpA-like peptidoglycan-associated protein